jgi:glycosyltransferase involved in cell wall biosynthesis
LRGVNVKLMLAGPFHTRSSERTIKDMIRKRNLSDIVSLSGPLWGENKGVFYKSIDIFVLTSRHEGMPNAVLEAMAWSKPVIVTPGTNTSEIVAASGGGWVAPLDAASIAQTIVAAVSDPGDIASRGIKARGYVVNNLTWEKVAERYCDELGKVLKTPSVYR